jgi:hypothetical protein
VKTVFLAIYVYERSFYQDRLGTNIGKALKNRLPFSYRWAWVRLVHLERLRGARLSRAFLRLDLIAPPLYALIAEPLSALIALPLSASLD